MAEPKKQFTPEFRAEAVRLAYSDEAGRGFRFEAGRRSEAKPATIPI
jgi:transposase-like protein